MKQYRRYLHYLIVVVLCASVHVAAAKQAPAAAATGCPSDVAAALKGACPCGTFRNHAQYMDCVRTHARALEKSGCDKTQLNTVARCASMSTCGDSKVVCCVHGRAETLPAERCTKQGGSVMTGATSSCDVSCPAAGTQNQPASAQGSPAQQRREQREARRKAQAGQPANPSWQQVPAGQQTK